MGSTMLTSPSPSPSPAHAASAKGSSMRVRAYACLALACAVGVVVLLVTAEPRAVGVLATAVVALVIAVVGLWWFASRRGVPHWIGAGVAVLAPTAMLGWYAYRGVLWVVVAVVVLSLLGFTSARLASRLAMPAPATSETAPQAGGPPLEHPYLIMNPRSGGGKVGKFHLAETAATLGAEVELLHTGDHQDVAEMATKAVDRGADLLGVAGGDGTQALVAAVAAEHGLPFLVVSAGTRNHFALDLGLDRDDPNACLGALYDGIEVCTDLGDINGRTFVNNASFGAYAELVQSPGYRDDKRGTTLNMLPELLSRRNAFRLRVSVGGELAVEGPTALLVSNNPYGTDDFAGLGRRHHLDEGQLGVVAVTVDSAAHAAQLLTGVRSKGLQLMTAREVVVDCDAEEIPVGIDGEAVWLRTPVVCRIRPRALRVRLPRVRPGPLPEAPSLRWSTIFDLALGRPVSSSRP